MYRHLGGRLYGLHPTILLRPGRIQSGKLRVWAGLEVLTHKQFQLWHPAVPRRIGIVWSRSSVRVRLVTVLLQECKKAIQAKPR